MSHQMHKGPEPFRRSCVFKFSIRLDPERMRLLLELAFFKWVLLYPHWDLFVYFVYFTTQEDIKQIIFIKVLRGV